MESQIKYEIRKAIHGDKEAIKQVLESTGLFPALELDSMMDDYLNNINTAEIWFCCLSKNVPVAFGYCVPEKLTDGTYNLLAIAVDADLQGTGIGSAMMQWIEYYLRIGGNRILIVETSGDEAYEMTRRFYTKIGYQNVATIKDFWKEGEDKIIYYKKVGN